MKHYFGIDGGGTKTTALLCDEKGQILSFSKGESINFNSVGTKAAIDNLKKITEDILTKSGISSVNSCFIGLSALSDRADDEFTKQFCKNIIPCGKIVMDSDAFIGLESMHCQTTAAMVISGTGSMAVGRHTDGKIIYTGGWGYILGDEGSGYSISLNAIKAAICSFESNETETILTDAVKEYFKIKDMRALIDVFYDPPLSRSKIAAFAPKVFECALKEDVVAKGIILSQAKMLSDTTVTLLRQLPYTTPVGLWGGIFQNSELFRNQFISYIKQEFPDSSVDLLKQPPLLGAVFAAMENDGLTVTDSIIQSLSEKIKEYIS